MTKRYHNSVSFSPLKRRKVELNFEGGDVTSDGGAVLLREIDKKLKLTESVSKAIEDKRRPSYCTHSQLTLLRQRIYGLALGYEDLNDHASLRHDGALQTAAGELGTLGSASTLCRLEQNADMSSAFKLHEILIDQFIASFKAPPKRLTLDFDATHDLVYGEQEKGIGSIKHRFAPHSMYLTEIPRLIHPLNPANLSKQGPNHSNKNRLSCKISG